MSCTSDRSRLGSPVSAQICFSRFLMVSTLSWQEFSSLAYPSGPLSVRGPVGVGARTILSVYCRQSFTSSSARSRSNRYAFIRARAFGSSATASLTCFHFSSPSGSVKRYLRKIKRSKVRNSVIWKDTSNLHAESQSHDNADDVWCDLPSLSSIGDKSRASEPSASSSDLSAGELTCVGLKSGLLLSTASSSAMSQSSTSLLYPATGAPAPTAACPFIAPTGSSSSSSPVGGAEPRSGRLGLYLIG